MDIFLGLALSMHLSFEQDYNRVHPHIRLQQDNFIAGAYYNSEETLSAYSGIELSKGNWSQEFGLVTGYSDADLLPYFRTSYNTSNNSKIFAAPAFENGNLGLVLGIEFIK